MSTGAIAQEGKVKTLFNTHSKSSGGYGAITNKFSTIRGEFVNMPGFYGGWYINHRFLLGVGATASTTDLRVPLQYSTDPTANKTYQYGQFGLMTEYVLASDKPVHLVFQAFGGAGFTLQYERDKWDNIDDESGRDDNWFFVAEPGVQLELNLFKWMRFSPGVSYRATFGSDGRGLKDKDLSALTYSATLKFGRF
jgi:hypothetical protein